MAFKSPTDFNSREKREAMFFMPPPITFPLAFIFLLLPPPVKIFTPVLQEGEWKMKELFRKVFSCVLEAELGWITGGS